ncbi:MAG: SDR family NAD(P)-dependent oxidoreductase [Candidatus Heimdallarchaeota archaeon]|nr:SDR family NAD(P)-dependent oxidoreductase [Candidatus Heimdallarchaeota archaeon]MCK5142537.1 SDR family NAD(P)-dependent oxidoreductase [Candidatus Heimdallarchaeota archaeon]
MHNVRVKEVKDSPIRDKVVVITGASSGIGKAVSLALAEHKPKLVIVARRKKKLMQTAKGLRRLGLKVLPITADVRNSDDRNRIIDFSITAFGSIDVFINNAGLGKVNLFLEQPEEEINELIDTNIVSLIKLTQKAAKVMKEQGHGHIINLSSTLAMLPTYPFAVYSATKSAVKIFDDCIREEMLGHGILVSTVLPGPYNTEFNQVANIGKASFKGYKVAKLAQEIVKLILKPKENLIQPKMFRLLIWITKRSKKIKKKVVSGIASQIIAGKHVTDRELTSEKEVVKAELQIVTS